MKKICLNQIIKKKIKLLKDQLQTRKKEIIILQMMMKRKLNFKLMNKKKICKKRINSLIVIIISPQLVQEQYLNHRINKKIIKI